MLLNSTLNLLHCCKQSFKIKICIYVKTESPAILAIFDRLESESIDMNPSLFCPTLIPAALYGATGCTGALRIPLISLMDPRGIGQQRIARMFTVPSSTACILRGILESPLRRRSANAEFDIRSLVEMQIPVQSRQPPGATNQKPVARREERRKKTATARSRRAV